MKGYVDNIEAITLANRYFRRVLYTSKNCQLVVMSIEPHDDIGLEVHHLDQFIRCEAGQGKAILGGKEHAISDGFAIIVPAGMEHNIVNTSPYEQMKLYTIYAPPHHQDGVIHATKGDALGDDEEFDGKTSE